MLLVEQRELLLFGAVIDRSLGLLLLQ